MPTAVERSGFDVFSPRGERGPDIQINFAVDTFRGQVPAEPQKGEPGKVDVTFDRTGDSLALNIFIDPTNPNHGPPELDLLGLNVAGLDWWHHG